MRTLSYAAAALLVAFTAGAQEVRVEVVRHADGVPIPGALVAILSDSGAPVGRFSGRDGRAILNPPRRIGYRVRVEKVGYDVWTSALLVASERPTRVRAGMKVRSLRLPPLTGSTETRCSTLGEQASAVSDMWGEIRKALYANTVTEAQGLAPLEIETYDRVVDANGTVLTQRNDRRRSNGMGPHNAIESGLPALAATPTRAAIPSPVFRVPEAATLLSDQFIATHCFTGIRGTGAENGLLGLEFKPAKLSREPDLAGVLWLDPTTYSLRHLVFEYVNLPPAAGVGQPRGRVEYQHLAGGEWVVTRWQLRVPRGRGESTSGARATRGYHEIGGVARNTGAPAAVAVVPVASSTEGTRITGTVIDGTTGAPLAGVEVSTFSGRQKTSTNRGGGYELWMEGSVRDSLVFDHPRLRLFRVQRVRPFFVTGGNRVQVSVVTPSYEVLRQGLCRASGTGAQPGGLAIGYVRDASGNPVANATVSATWRVLWVEEKGRLVSTNQLRTADGQTDADGSYLLCGFTRDAPVTIRVSVDGTPRVEEQLGVPRHMVIERNFIIPTTGGTASGLGGIPARAIFESMAHRERTYDPAMADLYCETAQIRTTRVFPNGQRRTLEFTVPQFKSLIHSLMPVAKAHGEYSTFSNVKYVPEGGNVRVTATRYSELKKYSAPHSVVIGACNGDGWGILDESSETRP